MLNRVAQEELGENNPAPASPIAAFGRCMHTIQANTTTMSFPSCLYISRRGSEQ